jgi:hypothetical protein
MMSADGAASKSTHRSKHASPSEYIFVDTASIERHMRREARKLFVLERADILMQLPASYKRNFGRVVFWMKKYPMPVLCVSPYEVPPGTLRGLWVQRFLEVRLMLV